MLTIWTTDFFFVGAFVQEHFEEYEGEMMDTVHGEVGSWQLGGSQQRAERYTFSP